MAYEIHRANKREALLPRVQEPDIGAFPLLAADRLGFARSPRIVALGSLGCGPKAQGRSTNIKRSALRPATSDTSRRKRQLWNGSKAGTRGDSDSITVAEACREYVANRREEKGTACAHDAEKRFQRTVYENKPFASIPLSKLRASRIRAWRDGLGLSKAASNRTLTTLKAALNLAVTHRRVHPGISREWADVKSYPNATRRRTLFLDLRQRRKLLEASQGALRDLIAAAALTGAQAGELRTATRGQFDARLRMISFNGEIGARTIPLSVAAGKLFKGLAKSKLPSAPLLTRDDGKAWAHSDWDELVRSAAEKRSCLRGYAPTPFATVSSLKQSPTG